LWALKIIKPNLPTFISTHELEFLDLLMPIRQHDDECYRRNFNPPPTIYYRFLSSFFWDKVLMQLHREHSQIKKIG
jgi:hypothetical protein